MPGGQRVDQFSFFFAFYGLILGLAVAELLSGFASYARVRRLRDLDLQVGLLALLIFLDICATWLDTWRTLRTTTLNFAGFWAPVLIATCFYLSASLVFPRDADDLDRLDLYFARRKRFVAVLLLAAELLIGLTFLGQYAINIEDKPAIFWLWQLPYKLALLAGWVGLILVTGRRANLIVIGLLILLFTIPYWTNGALPDWIHDHVDRPA